MHRGLMDINIQESKRQSTQCCDTQHTWPVPCCCMLQAAVTLRLLVLRISQGRHRGVEASRLQLHSLHAHKAPTFETYTLEPNCRPMTTHRHHVHTSVPGEQRIWLLLILHLVKHWTVPLAGTWTSHFHHPATPSCCWALICYAAATLVSPPPATHTFPNVTADLGCGEPATTGQSTVSAQHRVVHWQHPPGLQAPRLWQTEYCCRRRLGLHTRVGSSSMMEG